MLRAMLGLNVPFKRGEKIGPLSIWEVVPLFIQQTEWVIHPYQDRGRWQHSCLERDRQCWDGEHTQHTQHQGGGGALTQGRAQGLTTSVADCCSAPTEQCFPLTPSVLPRWSRHCGDLHLGSPFRKSLVHPLTPAGVGEGNGIKIWPHARTCVLARGGLTIGRFGKSPYSRPHRETGKN